MPFWKLKASNSFLNGCIKNKPGSIKSNIQISLGVGRNRLVGSVTSKGSESEIDKPNQLHSLSHKCSYKRTDPIFYILTLQSHKERQRETTPQEATAINNHDRLRLERANHFDSYSSEYGSIYDLWKCDITLKSFNNTHEFWTSMVSNKVIHYWFAIYSTLSCSLPTPIFHPSLGF